MTTRLCQSTIGQMAEHVAVPQYKLDRVQRGIVHIGVGNFFRAHQATFWDDLLCAGQMNWGVSGISLRSSRTHDVLAPQDFLYTLVQAGRNTTYRVIGALKEIIVAPSMPSRAVAALSAREASVVTTTVTEKGYLLRDGAIDFNHVGYRRDLSCLDPPTTVFGYLAASMVQRMVRNSGPMTVICCDNVSGGGAILAEGTCRLLRKHAREVVNWADENVSFATSVVDRVTPVTTDGLARQVRCDTGVVDAWPVATESFRQWVIEDKFAGQRPPLDSVGALFSSDIAAHERMKLAYLNAGHSMVGVMGYLLGVEHIHSSLGNDAVDRFVRRVLTEDVHPLARLPRDVDGLEYVDAILQRFKNASLPYRISQVCSDSTEKVQQRWFPSVDRLVRHGRMPRYFPVALAAWIIFIERAVAEGSLVDPSREKLIDAVRRCRGGDSVISGVLQIAGAASYAFWTDPIFMKAVKTAYSDIRTNGIYTAIARKAKVSRAGGKGHA